jgi:heme A synthase
MILAVLFCLQIAIGAIQIALVLPPLWRALHLAAASGVWAALIVLTILASNPLPEQRGSPA